jgi:hypothetical protein
MPDPKIKGSASVNEKPHEVSYDPRRGLSVRRKYTAAGGDAALLGIEASAQAAGYTTRKIVSPVLSELDILSPETEPGGGSLTVTDQWQLVGNEITKSIYESPPALELEEANGGAINFIRQAVDAKSSSFVTSFGGGYDITAAALFNMAIRGQDSYLLGQYVLRHTTNCSSGYVDNVSDDNVFRVYTTSQLLSECQSAALWVQPLAGRLVNKIGNIVEPDSRTGYIWGWLKKPSSETTTPDNRIEITQEYWLEQWPTLLYPAAV